jgi:hypothetical protein
LLPEVTVETPTLSRGFLIRRGFERALLRAINAAPGTNSPAVDAFQFFVDVVDVGIQQRQLEPGMGAAVAEVYSAWGVPHGTPGCIH